MYKINCRILRFFYLQKQLSLNEKCVQNQGKIPINDNFGSNMGHTPILKWKNSYETLIYKSLPKGHTIFHSLHT